MRWAHSSQGRRQAFLPRQVHSLPFFPRTSTHNYSDNSSSVFEQRPTTLAGAWQAGAVDSLLRGVGAARDPRSPSPPASAQGPGAAWPFPAATAHGGGGHGIRQDSDATNSWQRVESLARFLSAKSPSAPGIWYLWGATGYVHVEGRPGPPASAGRGREVRLAGWSGQREAACARSRRGWGQQHWGSGMRGAPTSPQTGLEPAESHRAERSFARPGRSVNPSYL